MGERTERSVLNHLIETCKDGERGFVLAADHVTDPLMRVAFLEAAEQRQRFADALRPHAQRLGGDPDTGGTMAGTLHRGWMTLKDALTRYDEAGILAEAERGEQAAAVAYDDALNSVLAPATRGVVEAQYADILKMRGRIHALVSVRG